MLFKNLATGATKSIAAPPVGVLLIGPLYFLFTGLVVPALVLFAAALVLGMTFGMLGAVLANIVAAILANSAPKKSKPAPSNVSTVVRLLSRLKLWTLMRRSSRCRRLRRRVPPSVSTLNVFWRSMAQNPRRKDICGARGTLLHSLILSTR